MLGLRLSAEVIKEEDEDKATETELDGEGSEEVEDDKEEEEEEVNVEDLYIPDVDEMEKEIAYLSFRVEKEEIITKHWRRLYFD